MVCGMFASMNLRKALLKAAIVLVPTYTAAYITGEMVWVVPTLAAAGFFAATIGSDPNLTMRVDEDGDGDDDQGGGDEEEEGLTEGLGEE